MNIIKYFPEEAKKALTNNGANVISEIGHDVLVDVVHDVLIGENLRNSTELLTRKRLLTLNAAIVHMIVEGISHDENFIINLHSEASKRLLQKGVPKEEKWILEWILGLTDKAFQNVLRDDTSNLERYQKEFSEVIEKSNAEFSRDYGVLSGKLQINDKAVDIDWNVLSNLMTIIGSQTLAIRGSDKSTFGKLFEKLVLGSLLEILGFRQVVEGEVGDGKKVYWLSERKEKRESDATILLEKGKGVRFDIGFIGRGNPEITLDKVSRFEREIELHATKYHMTTIIVVDRVGANSRIETLAEAIDGHIVQMSGAYWVKNVAKILKERFNYKDEILDKTGLELQEIVRSRLDKVDFTKLIGTAFQED